MGCNQDKILINSFCGYKREHLLYGFSLNDFRDGVKDLDSRTGGKSLNLIINQAIQKVRARQDTKAKA